MLRKQVVSLVKHLEKYPTDGVAAALENVVSFDSHDARLRAQASCGPR